LTITFFCYSCCTSPINDNSSLCFGFNEVSGLPIWLFWSQILKFWLFWTHLALSENQKKPDNSWLFLRFFSRKDLSLAKHYLRCIFITNLFYDAAGCKEYCKDFSVALKMFNLVNKKQMYDSVITRKENASKDRYCIMSMFLTCFNIHFCLVMHVSCAYVLRLLSGWLGRSLAFFCEDRLATLRDLSRFVRYG